MNEPTGPTLLHEAAARVNAWTETSAARARQVRWVAGEYSRALALEEHRLDEDAAVGDLFAYEPVQEYLDLAARGLLRVRPAAAPDRPSEGSRQVRVQVLHHLARAAGAPRDGLPPVQRVGAKKPVTLRHRQLLRESLQVVAEQQMTPQQLRMLTIGVLVTDTAARAGELSGLEVEDLSPGLEEARLLRRQQGAYDEEAYLELAALSPLSQAALKRWLPERQDLLRGISGTSRHLLVTLHANHRGGAAIPPGTPLQPRGLARAWTRAVAETNVLLAGEAEWAPLPTRMDQLRRGVHPEVADAPRAPDAERSPLLLDALTAAASVLAEERRREVGAAAEHQARIPVRRAAREAWAEGLPHTLLLQTAAAAGLHSDEALAAAGWEPVLRHALNRGSRAART